MTVSERCYIYEETYKIFWTVCFACLVVFLRVPDGQAHHNTTAQFINISHCPATGRCIIYTTSVKPRS